MFSSFSGLLIVGARLVTITSLYSYYCYILPSLSVIGIFLHFSSSSAFLRSLFTQSSHLNCGLPRFLQPSCFFVSHLFGDLSSFILTLCPALFTRLLFCLLLQATAPILSLQSFYTGHSPYPVVLAYL